MTTTMMTPTKILLTPTACAASTTAPTSSSLIQAINTVDTASAIAARRAETVGSEASCTPCWPA